MRALLCRTFGPPQSLEIADIAAPAAGAGEILAEVAFVGLNFMDTLIIENKYQVKPPLPFSPGAEFSGRVAAIGPGVSGFAVGDRVAGFTGFGAAQALVACPAAQAFIVPDGVPLEKAAGLWVTYGTSLHALRQRGRLQPGETLAVLGASGGVGLAAVEIGVLMGAKVIACASSPDKVAFALAAGAELGIDYSAADLKLALKAATEGKGVDVIYDPVGGNLSEAALRAIAWGGRHLVIGFAAGEIPRIPLNLALLKGCDIAGVFWGEFVKRLPEVNRANMADIADWVQDGRLCAHVHGLFPLADAAAALDVLKRREAVGKVVLAV